MPIPEMPESHVEDKNFDLVAHFEELLETKMLNPDASHMLDYFCTLAALPFIGKAEYEEGFTSVAALHQRLAQQAAWQCPRCFAFVQSDRWKQMQRHLHKHTPPNDQSYQYPAFNGVYICLLCAMTFPSRALVVEHYQTSHTPEDLKKVGMRMEVLHTRTKRTADNEAKYREALVNGDPTEAPPNKKRLKRLMLKQLLCSRFMPTFYLLKPFAKPLPWDVRPFEGFFDVQNSPQRWRCFVFTHVFFAQTAISSGLVLDLLRGLKAAADQPSLLYLDVKKVYVTKDHVVIRTGFNTRNADIRPLADVPDITGRNRRFFWVHMMLQLRDMSYRSVYSLDGANPENWHVNATTMKPLFVGIDTLTTSKHRVRLEGLYEIELIKGSMIKEENPDRVFGQGVLLLILHEISQANKRKQRYKAHTRYTRNGRLSPIRLQDLVFMVQEATQSRKLAEKI